MSESCSQSSQPASQPASKQSKAKQSREICSLKHGFSSPLAVVQ
jgi:hypothetical protein